MSILGIAGAVLMLAAGTTAAQPCAKDPKNLLSKLNCGFDTTTDGWKAAEGDASIEPGKDETRGGTLLVVAGPSGSVIVNGPCVKVKPATPYRFGAHVRSVKGTPYVCAVNTFQFTEATCAEGADPLAGGGLAPDATWKATEEAKGTTAAAVVSVRLVLMCSGEPGFRVQVDDAFLSE